jgi:aspartate kinase
VVSEAHAEAALKALHSEFNREIIKEINSDENVCVVAVVGAGMAGTPGVAKRVFGALGNSMINIIMISQGSSQYNISFVVREEDAFVAVRILHDEFKLYKEN